MAYNQELNDFIDDTKLGILIKASFKTATRKAENLKKVATDAIAPDGEFTSPVASKMSNDDKLTLKGFIDAIDEATTEYLAKLALINPKPTEQV